MRTALKKFFHPRKYLSMPSHCSAFLINHSMGYLFGVFCIVGAPSMVLSIAWDRTGNIAIWRAQYWLVQKSVREKAIRNTLQNLQEPRIIKIIAGTLSPHHYAKAHDSSRTFGIESQIYERIMSDVPSIRSGVTRIRLFRTDTCEERIEWQSFHYSFASSTKFAVFFFCKP